MRANRSAVVAEMVRVVPRIRMVGGLAASRRQLARGAQFFTFLDAQGRPTPGLLYSAECGIQVRIG